MPRDARLQVSAWCHVEPFHPTLVGTYPLGLQVDRSDFEIVCTCEDLDAFEATLRATLSSLGITRAKIERLPIPAVVRRSTSATSRSRSSLAYERT
jgi:hypothetical protein